MTIAGDQLLNTVLSSSRAQGLFVTAGNVTISGTLNITPSNDPNGSSSNSGNGGYGTSALYLAGSRKNDSNGTSDTAANMSVDGGSVNINMNGEPCLPSRC
ncbi:hypothetical protein ACYATO_08365 [Lactobacillaceae bacterium Melli_B3]